MMFPMPHILMFVSMVLIQVFAMPYVATLRPTHVRFTCTQAYMGVFMGACMVGVEGIMHPMPWWAWQVTVIVGAASVVAYRWQIGIDDREWLRDMIPHHSMALLTTRQRIASPDPFTQRLAERIVTSQQREIGEMAVHLETMRVL